MATASVETEPVDATTVDATSVDATSKENVNGGESATSATAHQAAAPARASTRARRPLVTPAMAQQLCARLARLVRIATVIAVALVTLGIVFHVLDANVHKWLVSDVEDAGSWLSSPFQNTFLLHDAKLALALNWAIALVIYAILGPLVARMVQGLPDRIGRRG